MMEVKGHYGCRGGAIGQSHGQLSMTYKVWKSTVGSNMEERLRVCRYELRKWSRDHSISFRKDIKECKERMDALGKWEDEDSGRGFLECMEQLNSLLCKEEMAWKQRAKQFWMRDGDLNTRFFHRSANGRRAHKALTKLQDQNGLWEEIDEGMGRVAVGYFTTLFTAGNVVVAPVIDAVERRVIEAHNIWPTRPFSEQEFKKACFAMHPDKALGLDGLNPAFFQYFWETIGKDITGDCMKCGYALRKTMVGWVSKTFVLSTWQWSVNKDGSY
ncbi:hypothetical protein LINGRAHAP2_LOCUS31878 [Linum grandiflorum]